MNLFGVLSVLVTLTVLVPVLKELNISLHFGLATDAFIDIGGDHFISCVHCTCVCQSRLAIHRQINSLTLLSAYLYTLLLVQCQAQALRFLSLLWENIVTVPLDSLI